ncbi:hypothetical protein CRYUN_Cryun14cG0100100 [Craigia yunnanensis]
MAIKLYPLVLAVSDNWFPGDVVKVRQSWQDYEWVVIGQDSGSCEDGKYGANSTIRCNQNSSSQFQNMIRRRNRHMKGDCGPIKKKVDAVAFLRDMLGEKYIHASVNNKTRLSEVHADKRKPNGAVGCYFAENLKTNDVDSVKCSVGSCSVSSNNFHKLPHCVSTGPTVDIAKVLCG